jgi:HEAT repeat protein
VGGRMAGRAGRRVAAAFLGAALLVGGAVHGRADDARGEPRETPEQVASAERLEAQLGASNKLDSKAAIEGLGALRTPTARRILEDYVKASKNAEWSQYAVRALGWSGNKASVDFLCGKHGLDSKKLLVAEEACRSLATIGERRAVPSLLEAMKGDKVVITRAAILAVVKLDPKADGIAVHMNKLATHKSSQVREVVAQAMGKMERAQVVPALVTMATKDGNSIVRLEACKSLGELGAKEAFDALSSVAENDKSADVRRAASAALQSVGSPEK